MSRTPRILTAAAGTAIVGAALLHSARRRADEEPVTAAAPVSTEPAAVQPIPAPRVTLEEIRVRRRKRHTGKALGSSALVLVTIAAWVGAFLLQKAGVVHVAESLGWTEPPAPDAPFVAPDDFTTSIVLTGLPLLLVFLVTVVTVLVIADTFAQSGYQMAMVLVISASVVGIAGSVLTVVGERPLESTNNSFIEWADARYGVDLTNLPASELASLYRGETGLDSVVDIETGRTVTSYTNSQGTILVDDPISGVSANELPVITR